MLDETGGLVASAERVFGDRYALAQRYAELLRGPGVERGLLGPREGPRVWERHLLNSAVLGDLIPDSARVVDVGSGAGLPGIPLALARPDLRVTLVEPMLRRTEFLDECVRELGLDRVDVVRGRAEDLSDEIVGEVVVARAVARLDRLLGWTVPLAVPGGQVLAMKGTSVASELAELGLTAGPEESPTEPRWRRRGVHGVALREIGCGIVDPPATVVCVTTSRKGRCN